MIAALFFGVLIVVLFKRTIPEAAPLVLFMLILYVPLGFYTDTVIWRRRMKKQGRPVDG